MHDTIKRAGLLLLVMIFMVAYLIFTLRKNTTAEGQLSAVIVIDPGHGGIDGGAVGVNTGCVEKDLNLKIAKKLANLLNGGKIKNKLTRKKDEALSGDNFDNRRELTLRLKTANASPSNILVSIHMNFFPAASCRGPQIFYAEKIDGSQLLASYIRQSLIDVLGESASRQIKPVDSQLYLLANAEVPAVIVECGFLSNPEEEKLLCAGDYQSTIALGIKNGVVKFLKSY